MFYGNRISAIEERLDLVEKHAALLAEAFISAIGELAELKAGKKVTSSRKLKKDGTPKKKPGPKKGHGGRPRKARKYVDVNPNYYSTPTVCTKCNGVFSGRLGLQTHRRWSRKCQVD